METKTRQSSKAETSVLCSEGVLRTAVTGEKKCKKDICKFFLHTCRKITRKIVTTDWLSFKLVCFLFWHVVVFCYRCQQTNKFRFRRKNIKPYLFYLLKVPNSLLKNWIFEKSHKYLPSLKKRQFKQESTGFGFQLWTNTDYSECFQEQDGLCGLVWTEATVSAHSHWEGTSAVMCLNSGAILHRQRNKLNHALDTQTIGYLFVGSSLCWFTYFIYQYRILTERSH